MQQGDHTYTKVPNWIWEAEMKPREKLVLIALYRFANADAIFPSLALIARMTNLSKRTVMRALKGLVEKGFITVEKRPGYTSIYTLTKGNFSMEIQEQSTPQQEEKTIEQVYFDTLPKETKFQVLHEVRKIAMKEFNQLSEEEKNTLLEKAKEELPPNLRENSVFVRLSAIHILYNQMLQNGAAEKVLKEILT